MDGADHSDDFEMSAYLYGEWMDINLGGSGFLVGSRDGVDSARGERDTEREGRVEG